MYKKLELTKNNIILDLEKSDHVKVSNWYEAFWIKDIDFDKKHCWGEINNNLIWDYWYNIWDKILFNRENVLKTS